MEELGKDKIVNFNERFTTHNAQILKICYSYVAPKYQTSLAALIKFLELNEVLSCKTSVPSSEINIKTFYQETKELLYPDEKESVEKIFHLFEQLKSYQEILEMVKLFKSMESESDSPSSCGNEVPDDISSLLTPELSSMIEMIKMFSQQ